jgi:hypothetical protein
MKKKKKKTMMMMMRRRRSRRRKQGCNDTHYAHYYSEGNRKFPALKFPRCCSVILLVKDGSRHCRAMGTGEEEVMVRGSLEYAVKERISPFVLYF